MDIGFAPTVAERRQEGFRWQGESRSLLGVLQLTVGITVNTIDSIFSDETGTKSGTESGTHPELLLESEALNESDLDWF